MTELLLAKGYHVVGVVRQMSSLERGRIDHLPRSQHLDDTAVELVYGDLCDTSTIRRLITDVQPDEIYNLAAQSHVRVSLDMPEYTFDVTCMGAVRLLEALRQTGCPARFYQASTSEMFGKASESPQTETTPFHPRNPYAVAKTAAHMMAGNYCDSYGMFVSCGILYNHESPRRGENYVTRKITLSAARIKLGLQDELALGNLDTRRDWGYSGDFVRAMWLMLQQEEPGDYVVATGKTHTLREFLDIAFGHVGLNWKDYVRIDPHYYRPLEPEQLVGDPTKAREILGWQPTVTFEELVKMMVEADLKRLSENS